jgi:hypothetical protein
MSNDLNLHWANRLFLWSDAFILQSSSRRVLKYQVSLCYKKYMFSLFNNFVFLWFDSAFFKFLLKRLFIIVQTTPRNSISFLNIKNDPLIKQLTKWYSHIFSTQWINREIWMPGLFSKFDSLFFFHGLHYLPKTLFLFASEDNLYAFDEIVKLKGYQLNVVSIMSALVPLSSTYIKRSLIVVPSLSSLIYDLHFYSIFFWLIFPRLRQK